MKFRAAHVVALVFSLIALTLSRTQTNSASALRRQVRSGGTVKGFSKNACIFLVFFAMVIASPAQTFQSLVSFDNLNGYGPQALVQGTDGSFYGTAFWGGTLPCVNSEGCGTVFKITAGGKLTVLHEFGVTDGFGPNAPLVQGTDGSFYGTTSSGGTGAACSIGCGTVFKISSGGSFLTLHDFDGTDGEDPGGGLVRGTDGNFYGTTGSGTTNYGTVFKITPGGTLTTLHNFEYGDGSQPYGALEQATDGSFYGTTGGGGPNPCGQRGCGTVFKISSDGSFVSLHSFDYTDGYGPTGGLVQATDGKFYGTTLSGGANGYGTIFDITSGGVLTTLYSFCAPYCADGTSAFGLVQATDGNFYGTMVSGGTNAQGTVFKITSGGVLTTLYDFCTQPNCSDGSNPQWPPLQATDGNFYGTTGAGGNDTACVAGCGTVYSLSAGLGPFVKTQPTSGKVGSAVKILGTHLTGATSVTFNGTVAKFTVVSKSEIKTTVPEGATTGKVEVKTPHGALKSNVVFRVSK
jgi:uncharacterized repeat protein (TIGR03803 family)